jgi:hypothetical protein
MISFEDQGDFFFAVGGVVFSDGVLAEACDVNSLTAEVARLTAAYDGIDADWTVFDPVISAVYEVLGVEEFESPEEARAAALAIRAKFAEKAGIEREAAEKEDTTRTDPAAAPKTKPARV